MHITVRCPRCQSEFHVEPNLRGLRMKCNSCGRPFLVEPLEDAAPATTPPPVDGKAAAQVDTTSSKPKSGTVGETVPLLPAEAVVEESATPAKVEPAPRASPSVESVVPLLAAEMVADAKPTPPAKEPGWREAPPVRRAPPVNPPKPPSSVEAKKAPPAKPAEPPSWMAAPPPVRRDAESSPTTKKPADEPATLSRKPAPTLKIEPTKPSGGTGVSPVRTGETPVPPPTAAGPIELPPGAWEAPPVRRPGAAEVTSSVPTEEPPHGEVAPATRRRGPLFIVAMLALFLVTMGGIGLVVWIIAGDNEDRSFQAAKEAYDRQSFALAGDRFVAMERRFPESERMPLYEFLGDLSQVRQQVYTLNADPAEGLARLEDFVKARQGNPLLDEYAADVGETFAKLTDDFTEKAKQSLDAEALAKAEQALTKAGQLKAAGIEARRKTLDEVRVAIARERRRQEVYVALDREAENPDKDSKRRVDEILADASRQVPGLRDDAEVKDRLRQIDDALRGIVTWHQPAVGSETLEPVAEEDDRSLLVVPGLVKSGSKDKGRVVFALVRGVLYALDQGSGRVRWATRVGIDTTQLPVRLPATEASREIALVLSSDTNTLTARDALSGQALWRHRLTKPCLGRPVIVDRRAFVPTYDGKIHEVEIVEGKLLGWYDLHQPLTVGGVHREGTSLLYFPADERSVFVLDMAKREPACVAIIPSEHPAGSLRCEPIIVSRDEIRTSARNGLEPADWPDLLVLNQADGLNAMKLRVFALSDPQRAGEVTSEVPRTPTLSGWAWFPPRHDGERMVQVTDAGALGIIGIKQMRNLDRDLFPENKEEMAVGAAVRSPGRALVVDAIEDDFWVLAQGELRLLHFNRFQQKTVPLWPQSLALGSPLHAGQVEATERGRKALFLVTQALGQPTCLATAVDGAVDARAGNILWQSQLGFLCKGEPLVLGTEVVAVDQGGGLFAFDSRKHQGGGDRAWQTGGQVLAGPLEDARAVFLVTDGAGLAYEIAARQNQRLIVRRFESGKPIVERTFARYPSAASAPAALSGGLVVALSDGKLLHVNVDERKASAGPEWRARHADREAVGFVVAAGGDEFLSSDGSRGLTRWRWPGGPMWEMLTTADLPERLIAPPVVLPRAEGSDELLVCVAAARETLTLLRDKGQGKKRTWNAVRSWPLGGRITAGPFRRGEYLGCVVDQQRLVWIDPNKDGIAWEYHQPGKAIIGQPQQVEEMIVVAHQTGQFVGLDPATGKPFGPGYTLKAHIAPAATPVSFGAGQAFAPLSDGTILMLSLRQLRHATREVPTN